MPGLSSWVLGDKTCFSTPHPRRPHPRTDAHQLRTLPACLCAVPCCVVPCCAPPPPLHTHTYTQIWELMYDTVDATHDCVRIATGVLSTLSINPERMMKV